MKTKEKLAAALREACAPSTMVDHALRGDYDDYESESATPIGDLVRDLKVFGLHDLATKAINGEFDGTKEESEAWFQREGKDLLK